MSHFWHDMAMYFVGFFIGVYSEKKDRKKKDQKKKR